MKKRIIIFGMIAVFWCGVIFFLSSENSGESSARSGRIITAICETFVPGYENYTESEKNELKADLSFAVRKAAHFTAYAILGALLFQLFYLFKNLWLRSVLAILCAFAYAASDEIHQSFVPGRSCEFRDMLIDTGGAALAVLISLLIIHLKSKRKRQKTA